MMKPSPALTQVREGNFSDEIADGISSPLLVLYRTACQDDVEWSGYTLMPEMGQTGGLDAYLSRLSVRWGGIRFVYSLTLTPLL
jgi:hypothetical protein